MLVCLPLAENLRETGYKSHLIFVINRDNWQMTLLLPQEPVQNLLQAIGVCPTDFEG